MLYRFIPACTIVAAMSCQSAPQEKANDGVLDTASGATSLPEAELPSKSGLATRRESSKRETQAKRLSNVYPFYPKHLRKRCVGERTILLIEVSKEGKVRGIRVETSAHPLLDELAMMAVRNSLWQPATVDGSAADSWIRYRMEWPRGDCLQKKKSRVPPDQLLNAAQKKQRDRCTGGNAWSCLQLGVDFELGRGVSQNYDVTEYFYQEGCALNDAASCLYLGVLLFSKNLGTKDAVTSALLYVKSCRLDARIGCGDASFRFLTGNGIEEDWERAGAFARRGCWGGKSLYACRMLAHYFKKTGKLDQAERVFDGACTRGQAESCKDLGDLLYWSAPEDAPAAYRRSFPLLKTGCYEHYSAIKCQMLADLYRQKTGIPFDRIEFDRAHAKACSLSKRHCR